MGSCCGKAERKTKIKPSTSFWDKTNKEGGDQQRRYASSTEDINFFYSFKRTLGKSKYGVVKEAIRKNEDEKKRYAIKIMPRHQYEKNSRSEIENLMKLDHPNICKFIETFIDNENVYLVMEYLSGGSLGTHPLHLKGEAFIAKIIQSLTRALIHMHANNIIHRNICLKNILFSDSTLETVKIINFSMSCVVQLDPQDAKKSKKNSPPKGISRALTKNVGSDGFTSPEVMLSSKYDHSCDVWSLGVVAYCLLSGEMPFQEDDAALQGELKFSGKVWRDISKEAKLVIQKMLQPVAKNRITLQKVLKSDWFSLIHSKKLEDKAIEYDLEDLVTEENVRNYCCANRFKQMCIKNLVKRAEDASLVTARTAFESIDNDKNGYIERDELKKLLEQQAYFKTSSKDTISLLLKYFFPQTKNQQSSSPPVALKFSDFLAATLNESQYSQDNIKALFNYLDTDSNHYLDFADLQDLMAREGTKIEEEEAMSIMEEYECFLKEGKLYFDDFYRLMIKNQTRLKESLSLSDSSLTDSQTDSKKGTLVVVSGVVRPHRKSRFGLEDMMMKGLIKQ